MLHVLRGTWNDRQRHLCIANHIVSLPLCRLSSHRPNHITNVLPGRRKLGHHRNLNILQFRITPTIRRTSHQAPSAPLIKHQPPRAIDRIDQQPKSRSTKPRPPKLHSRRRQPLTHQRKVLLLAPLLAVAQQHCFNFHIDPKDRIPLIIPSRPSQRLHRLRHHFRPQRRTDLNLQSPQARNKSSMVKLGHDLRDWHAIPIPIRVLSSIG